MNKTFSIFSVAILIASGFFSSCATTHQGQMGSKTDKKLTPLRVSAVTVDDRPDDPFQLIELTLENTSDKWLRYDRGEVNILNPAESGLSVVIGPDLKTWADAMELRNKKENFNTELALVGVSAVGAAATSAPRGAASPRSSSACRSCGLAPGPAGSGSTASRGG